MVYKKSDNLSKDGFILIPVLLTLTLCIVGVISFLYLTNKDTDTISDIVPSITISHISNSDVTVSPIISVTPTDIPLPPAINWKGPTVINKENRNDRYSVFLTDKRNGIYLEQVSLSGKLWIFEIKDDSPPQKERPDEYYDRILLSKGWTWGEKLVVNDQVELTPMMADGVTGGSFGYLQFENGKGRQVIVTTASFSSDDSIKAPYQSVFVSDEFTIEDLEK